MGQAMVTPMVFGREARESLLSNDDDEEEKEKEKGESFSGRIWRILSRFVRHLFRRIWRILLSNDDDDDDEEEKEKEKGESFSGRIWRILSRFVRHLFRQKPPKVPSLASSSPPLLPLSLLPPSPPPHHFIDIITLVDGSGVDSSAPISVQVEADSDQDVKFESLQAAKAIGTGRGRLGPYRWDEKILLVGEGDFSFSGSLAVAFGDASNIVSTSLDSKQFLMKNYKRAAANISELASRGSKVMHGVDATKMADHPQLRSLKFDCIAYNFPHAGFANRGASREAQICMHQSLVKGFLANAKKMIKADGRIHITHKCVGFLLEWNIQALGSAEGLRLVEETPFNARDYPGYSTKYGYGGDRKFDWKPSKRYTFQLLTPPPNKKKTRTRTKRNQIADQGETPSMILPPEEGLLRWGKIGPYSGDKTILVVGDGDFSFSASLAAAFGDASNLIATSLDSLEHLNENYKGAETNILALRSRGCKVIHGVDATSMATDFTQQRPLKFNYIVFNFPKAYISNPKPPRDAQIRKHQELVRGFLANAKKMIERDGQIHITHQCFGAYLEWNIEMLGSSEGLQLVEESPFNHREYRNYSVKFGCTGDGSFDCSPSKTYMFQLPASPKKKNRTRSRSKKNRI